VIGFWGGVRVFFEGIGYVVGTPAVWLPALVPVAMLIVLFGGAGALGLWGAVSAAAAIADGDAGAWHAIGLWLLRILFGGVALLVAALLALALAQPLSGWALDRIVRREERELGAPEHPELPRGEQMLRALGVNLLGLGVSLPVLGLLTAIGFFFPPAAWVTVPLKVLVGGLFIAWDFLDYPLSLRGMKVGARLAWIGQRFGAVTGFGACAALVLLVPCVGLFVLPFGVAGATRLVVRSSARAG